RVEAAAETLATESEQAAQALERIFANPVFVGQLLEARERRLRRVQARLRLLLLGKSFVDEPERLHDGGQRQTLKHERAEDDSEGEEDDQRAVRKRIAGIRRERERERCRQRDRPSHP